MTALFIIFFFVLYGTIIYMISPKKIQMKCSHCNKMQKQHLGVRCSCGNVLRYSDRMGDLEMKLIKFQLIK